MQAKYLNISDEDFVTAYAAAPSFKALCETLGAPSYSVRNKMTRLKKKHDLAWPRKPVPPRARPVDPAESEKLRALLSP